MKGFLDTVKCIHCKLILQTPINLPCGHTICKKHISDQKCHSYSCLSCGKIHTVPNDGFPLNHSLVFLIDLNLAGYKNALNACNTLKSAINEMVLIKNEQKFQFEREIKEIKSGICSKRDVLIKEITTKSEQMINEIEMYENEGQNSMEKMSDKFETVKKKVVEKNRAKLDEWLIEFSNSQTTSEVNLAIISEQCEFERGKLSELFEKTTEYLLKLDNYKENCDILGYFKKFVETQRFLNILIGIFF
jgi:hypothetical protein